MKPLTQLWLALALHSACAQTAPPQAAPRPAIVGTVSGFRLEPLSMAVKTDNGTGLDLRISADTQVQRVAPGEKDLKKAEPIPASAIRVGDRVLVSITPAGDEARRIVVMPASEISRQREAERLDWTKNGVAGVVAARKDGVVTLKSKGLLSDQTYTVNITGKTVFRRYAPDSVKFADAKLSSLAEIKPGDQLRARGEKEANGSTVTASEVVFGTLLTKAGTITAQDENSLTVKDLESGKPLIIRLTADSQLKRMPDFGAMPAAGAPGMMAGGGPPPIAQMIEGLPGARITDLKPGETVVVSSTQGATRNEVTAILLLGNAGMLIRMASAQQQANGRQQGGQGMMGGGMGGGMMGGGSLGGLELPGMMP